MKDGGPAFPELVSKEKSYRDEAGYARSRFVTESEGGMSLRDYFAAKAMQGMAAEMVKGGYPHQDILCGVPEQNLIAEVSYGLADAMLTERDKK